MCEVPSRAGRVELIGAGPRHGTVEGLEVTDEVVALVFDQRGVLIIVAD